MIIDGIDVSGCEHFNVENGKCYADGAWGTDDILCENNKNCPLKQLKRKEQECEEYKQALDEIEKIVEKYNIKIQNTIVSKPLEDLFDILQIIQKVKEQ